MTQREYHFDFVEGSDESFVDFSLKVAAAYRQHGPKFYHHLTIYKPTNIITFRANINVSSASLVIKLRLVHDEERVSEFIQHVAPVEFGATRWLTEELEHRQTLAISNARGKPEIVAS